MKRTSRGWLGCCPSHHDRHPSLSIAEGDHGILVRCWAGCTVMQIAEALGITVGDLFYDSNRRATYKANPPSKQVRPDYRKMAADLMNHADAHWICGTSVISAATGLDVSGWTEEELDIALNAVALAYFDCERARVLDDVAFSLRCRRLAEEKNHAVRRPAA